MSATSQEADLGFATVDLDRLRRTGVPEVIYGAGKTPQQVVAIATRILQANGRVLITRSTPEQMQAVGRRFSDAEIHQTARCITIIRTPAPIPPGHLAIVCAGTSDLPVAEEAAVTARFLGQRVEQFTDLGVAGLHRLLRRVEDLRRANVLIVVAGMEGALPSVVAGLVARPVIAVPTSVGYGANLGGIAALLGMLNSCGSGVTVVNIDNGFGAAFAAAQINALAAAAAPPTAPRIRSRGSRKRPPTRSTQAPK